MSSNTQNAALVAFLNSHLTEILDWLQTHSKNVTQVETVDYDSSVIVGILGSYENGGVQKVVNITPDTVVKALSGIQDELIALCKSATTEATSQGEYAKTQGDAAKEAAQLITTAMDNITSLKKEVDDAVEQSKILQNQSQTTLDQLNEGYQQSQETLTNAQTALTQIQSKESQVDDLIEQSKSTLADTTKTLTEAQGKVTEMQNAIDDAAAQQQKTTAAANAANEAAAKANTAATSANAAAGKVDTAIENMVNQKNSGNTLNMSEIAPLASGYYTLATAIKAVPEKYRALLRCITFSTADGAVTKQFTGSSIDSWEDTSAWADFGGGGKIKNINFNGTPLEPTKDGTVSINVDTIEVDNSLSGDSTNPVQNKVINAAIDELKNPRFNADVEDSDDGSTVTLTTQSGQQVAQFKVQGGGGSGGSTTSKIVLSASVSKAKVKEGGSAELKWYYNHVNSDGAEDGIVGDVTVTIKRGSVTLYEQTLTAVNPSSAAHSVSLDAWLKDAGTLGVYIKANAIDNGATQTKSYYVAVNVVSLALTLTNVSNIVSAISSGGYKDGDPIEIAYAIKGSGTKVVSMYIDGNATPTTQTVSKSGTTNGSFTITARNLSAGRHTIQLVAENDGLYSESTYIDILKAGSSAPFIGLYFVSDDGTVFTTDYKTPTIKAEQYESSTFQYVVYDPAMTPASLDEYQEGEFVKTYSVTRSLQDYTMRYTKSGIISEKFSCGSTEYSFKVNVVESTISVSKATAGLSFELLAAGRSNEEANPGTWENNGVKTTFSGFDWKSSGWIDNALVLKNGARIEIGSKIFDEAQDPAASGKTIEMEFKISNVINYDADIISCLYEGKGFRVKANKASMLTGSSVTYSDEDGNQQERTVGVEKIFASDMDVKLALVVGKRSEYRLMELYINGSREKADVYNTTDNFVQTITQGITVDSTAADVELRSVRVYDRALSDDEIVDNYIVDRKTTQEMLELYDKNDILNDNGDVDISKLLQKGKAVVRFIREGGLDEINSTNNKKTDFLSTVIFYSPLGSEWDFKIEGCNVRIQGTSSTKYPRKNYRIYLLKPSTAKFYRKDSDGNWVLQEDFKGWPNQPGDKPAPLICLKADYSDSSMTLNTGGARLFDAMMRDLDLLTPPQEVDSAVRQSIDGFPCDVFSSETEDGSIEYYGQYNFNNDKSKSGIIFGQSNVDNFDTSKSIALEFLNNTNEVGLFQAAGSANSEALKIQMAAKFDDGLEFNHPEDYTWSTIDTKVPGAQAGLLRLFGWIHDCVQECVTKNGLNLATTDYKNISLFKSSKFKSEIGDYFKLNHLLTYYLWTDYFMSVDQRVKNMLMRSWDLIHWYITYYDGDTALGKRNDSFIAYLYNITRESWDSDKSKYAFEGHNSWLWCLVLANFSDELMACAKRMRNVLTNSKVLEMLNVKQMGNWCERAYNKSGKFKYIDPATVGVRQIKNGVETDGVTYPFIYALDGTNYSHRLNTILNRFALLDAKYGCDSFKDDNVEMYLSRSSSDATGIVKITANNIYYFDWNTKNGSHSDLKKAEAGETVSLEFTGAITVNDPVDLYGASQMARLNLTGIAGSLQNGINLNKATVLQEIDASSTKACTQAWWFNFEKCVKLSKIDCTNQQGVKTGTSSSTEFDVSNQAKLTTLRLGGTKVQSVEIAEGAPLTECVLPDSLTVLKLSYLPLLQMSGLTVQSYANVETFIFTNCPGLDWQTLLNRCTNVKRIRIEGINMEDDGTFLAKYKDYKGVDADGNAVSTCQLVGDIYLTSYIDDARYEEYKLIYPSLNIHQPEYTMIEFDDNVSDDANISNLDNKTGYKFGNTYKASGHITKILSLRHRVLAKVTKKPTTRTVNMAGNDVTVNNPDGEMTYYPLHDENSNYYADAEQLSSCTPAKLDSTEGDIMMYEPQKWFKGINDYLNGKKYSCFSSNEKMPPVPKATVLTLDDIKNSGDFRQRYKIMTGKETLQSSYSSDSNYAVCHVIVKDYSRVRFPTVPGSNLVGSVFVNSSGDLLKSIVVPTLSNKFEAGMYLISDVPDGATDLYFTILLTAEFDKVVLSNSTKIEDMEPDWVHEDAYLCGVVGSSVVGDKLRACVTGGTTAASMPWTDFHYYSVQRGMQQIDPMMHSWIANLFYAKNGRRDVQEQNGAGQHTNNRTTGGTMSHGMTETIGYTEAHAINPNVTNSLIDNLVHQYAWYKSTGDFDTQTVTQVNNTCCLGYEDIYGNKYDMMDNVDLPNDSGNSGKWRILMPDGTWRKVKGTTSSDYWITAVAHGKYMDVIPVGMVNGSSSTYYTDKYWISISSSRVVYRGNYYASAVGGVANSDASSDASFSGAGVGSRLAFRGKLVKAQSVAAFKAISEAA